MAIIRPSVGTIINVPIRTAGSGDQEDYWGAVMFEASFGGLPLDVISTADVGGNRLVRHSFPHRDGAELEPMGKVARKTRCKIVFIPYSMDPSNKRFEEPGVYFREFMRIVGLPDPQRFTHPLTGSYMARVGEVNYNAEFQPRDTITVECTFEEDTLSPAVFEEKLVFYVTVEGAQASLDALNDELDALRTPKMSKAELAKYTAGVAALRTTAALSVKRSASLDPFKKLRDANLILARSLNDLDQRLEALNAHTDVRFYETITAVNDLKLSLRERWNATQRTAQFIYVEVRKPVSLHIIAAQIYGARESDERVTQIMQLNDVRNPLRVPEGTPLRIQAPGAPLNAGQTTIVPSSTAGTTTVPSHFAR